MVVMQEFEREAEDFHQEVYREVYLAEAGLKEQLSITPIYERHAHLFSQPMVRELLGMTQDRQGRYLAEFVTLEYMENRVKGLTEKISNVSRQATVEWQGEKVPYHNLRPLISNEPDMTRRRRLDELERGVTAGLNGERRERLGKIHDQATDLGFESYVTLCNRLRGLNLTWLTEQMRLLLDETRNAYLRHLESYLNGIDVPIENAARCDLLYLFRGKSFDSFFPDEAMIPAVTSTLAGMGIELARQQNLELDTEPRPLKSPRAFCAPIRIPEEVKLVVKPIGGPEDYSSLFHEAGHAEHFVHVDPGLDFAFKRLGDNSVTEGYAFLFEYLPLNQNWLREILGIEEANEFTELNLFQKLFFLRRYASKLLYERELHAGLEEAEQRYADLLGDALGVSIGAENYLHDVDDAFYCAQYLRAWIFEVQLRRFLERKFGPEWFASEKAGKHLISLWRRGQEFTCEELAADMGYEGLNAQYLVEELTSI